jgi:hypothetical protein
MFDKPLCKVGVSSSIPKRLKALVPCCPFELQLQHHIAFPNRAGAEWAERVIHLSLEQYRVNGEWFSVPALAAVDVYWGVMDMMKVGDFDPDDFVSLTQMSAFQTVGAWARDDAQL